jgi:hypothetical protein
MSKREREKERKKRKEREKKRYKEVEKRKTCVDLMTCMHTIHLVRVLLKLKNKIDDIAWATRFDVILFVEEMLNHFLDTDSRYF